MHTYISWYYESCIELLSSLKVFLNFSFAYEMVFKWYVSYFLNIYDYSTKVPGIKIPRRKIKMNVNL